MIKLRSILKLFIRLCSALSAILRISMRGIAAHLQVLIAFIFMTISTLHAADVTWADSGTDFNAGASWGGSAPGVADRAVIAGSPSNQPSLSGDITIDQLQFTGAGITLSDAGSNTLTLNGNVESSGAGTNTISASLLSVGTGGSDNDWTINAANTLNLSGNYSWTGDDFYKLGAGTLNLSGTNGTSGNIYFRNGTTNITGTYDNLGNTFITSTVNVNGGTLSNTGANELQVGTSSGNGVLNISNGGSVAMSGPNYLGRHGAGTGTLTLSGAGSSYTVGGDFDIGLANTGTMTASASSTFTAAKVSVGVNSNGFLTLTGTGTTYTGSGDLLIGEGTGFSGTMTVSNNANVDLNSDLQIGSSGSGTLTVNSGADVDVSGIAYLARLGSGAGTLLVTGTGSSFTAQDQLIVGSNGNGNATVSASAQLSVTNDTRVGAVGTGSLTISSGADATLAALSVGDSNTGTLTLTGSGSTITQSGIFKVGNGSGLTGTVAVSDSALLTINNNAEIGRSGVGSMTVNGGADVVVSGTTFLGRTTGGDGDLTVTGTGSTYTGNSSFLIGSGSGRIGDVTVSTGGTITSSTTNSIANATAGSGSLTVTGANSVFNQTNDNFTIGTAAKDFTRAEVHLDDGGVLNFSGGNIFNYGTIDLNGGTITSSGLLRNYGTIQGNGVLSIDTRTDDATAIYSADSGQTLELSGILSASGALNKNGAGTVKLSGSSANTYTGATVINAGILELAKTAGLDAIANGSINVTSGGTLKLGANNQIDNALDVTLSGGTFDINAYQEGSTSTAGIDNLIVSSASTIDFTGTGGILRFTNDTGSTSSANILIIDNWGGTPNGVHNTDLSLNTTGDRLLISASDFTVLSRSTDIFFSGWGAGAKFLETSAASGIYEILPDVEGNIWDGSTSGAWETNTNWVGDVEPDAAEKVAVFNSTGFASNGTVTLGAGKTVGQIVIDSNDYTIQSNTITMDGDSGAGINILGSSVNATISSNLALNDNLSVNVSNTSNLTLSGIVSGGSNALAKLGQGTLVLSGTNTYTGNTTINVGTLNLTGSVDGGIVLSGGTLIGGTDANAVAAALTMSSGTLSSNTIGTTGQFNVKGAGSSSWTGGTYVWDVTGGMGASGTDSDGNGYREASGSADGSLYDILAFTGALDFTGASIGSITIDIESYSSYTGYDWDTPTEIKIATASNIIGFNEAFFNLDTTGFNDATGSWWLNWGIASHSNALWLQYRAVPEPGTWVMIFTLATTLFIVAYRKKKRNTSNEY